MLRNSINEQNLILLASQNMNTVKTNRGWSCHRLWYETGQVLIKDAGLQLNGSCFKRYNDSHNTIIFVKILDVHVKCYQVDLKLYIYIYIYKESCQIWVAFFPFLSYLIFLFSPLAQSLSHFLNTLSFKAMYCLQNPNQTT